MRRDQTTVTVQVSLTPQQLAACMEHWGDEEQADVFIELARLAARWDCTDWRTQWYMVGRHLRTCACTTSEVQELVIELYRGLTDPLSKSERERIEGQGLDPDAIYVFVP